MPLENDVYEFYRVKKDGGLHDYYLKANDMFSFLCMSRKVNYIEVQKELKLPYESLWECKQDASYSKEEWKKLRTFIHKISEVILDGPCDKDSQGIWREKADLSGLLDFKVTPTPEKANLKNATPGTIR